VGRRRIFALGVSLFALASAACALAPGIEWLVAARGVQGVGAALLVPTSLALLSSGFPAERRGRAIGTWSAFSAAAGGAGPVLGGWLVQTFSWRWVFWINVPIALMTVIIILRWVPESREERPGGRLDVGGAVLATLGLGGLVFGLLEGPRLGFTYPGIIAALVAGVVMLVLFAVVEKRAAQPMVPTQLFRSHTFSGANLLTLLLYSAMSGALFFLPFVLVH
jgi:MFS family permease